MGIVRVAADIWHPARTGAPGFAPTDISGNILWLRSDLGVTLGDNLLSDGDMEDSGTSSWIPASATLTKETTSPHGGVRLLRATKTADPDSAIAVQTVLTIGQEYRLVGWARSDGICRPQVRDSGGGISWTGTTSTSWQAFDVTATALGTALQLRSAYGDGNIGDYVEFDDVSVVPTVGGNVSAWADQSSGGNHVSQSVVADQPEYLPAGGVSGFPGIKFDSINSEFLTGSLTETSTDYSVFVVLQTGTNIGYACIMGAASAGINVFLGTGYDASGLKKVFGFDTTYRVGDIDSAAQRWLEAHWDSGAGQVDFFKSDRALGSDTCAGEQFTGNFAIGRLQYLDTWRFDGTITEIIVYNRLLNASERTQVRDYLKARYEIPRSLEGVTDLCSHFRSDLGVTLDGSNVTAWQNQADIGNDLVQATAAEQPSYVDDGSGPNGYPFIELDGSNDELLGVWGLIQPFTRFAVLVPSVSAKTSYMVLWDGSVTNQALLYSPTAPYKLQAYAGAVLSHPSTIDFTDWHYIHCVYSGASSAVSIDGVNQAGSLGTNLTRGLRLGDDGTGTHYADIRIVELIDFDRALTAGEISTITSYLTARYGL